MQTPHGTVVWSELMTRDVQAAKDHYAATCGWHYELMKMDGGQDYLMASVGDRPVAGIMDISGTADYDGMPPHWFTYIAVDDVDAAVGKTIDMGGEVIKGPFGVPGIGRIAILKDPSGAAVGMITEVAQDS